jgi:hypothetical protein
MTETENVNMHKALHAALPVLTIHETSDPKSPVTRFADSEPVLYNLYRGPDETHSDRLLDDCLNRGLDTEKCQCALYKKHLKTLVNYEKPRPYTVRARLMRRVR